MWIILIFLLLILYVKNTKENYYDSFDGYNLFYHIKGYPKYGYSGKKYKWIHGPGYYQESPFGKLSTMYRVNDAYFSNQ